MLSSDANCRRKAFCVVCSLQTVATAILSSSQLLYTKKIPQCQSIPASALTYAPAYFCQVVAPPLLLSTTQMSVDVGRGTNSHHQCAFYLPSPCIVGGYFKPKFIPLLTYQRNRSSLIGVGVSNLARPADKSTCD